MLRGLQSAATAMEVAMANHEVIADNLAHASTPGFRRQGLLFEALSTPRADGSAVPIPTVRKAGEFSHYEHGPLLQTGNPLDLFLSGNAFFVVDGPQGPLYTRSGAFELDNDNMLRMPGGARVRGQGGPITIPNTGGDISVSADGAIFVGGNEVGRLQLAVFDDPSVLRRASGTTFEGPAPQTPPPGSVRVEQGYREGSNVQVVQEMISMMLGVRMYEAAEKTLRTISETVGLSTKPQ